MAETHERLMEVLRAVCHNRQLQTGLDLTIIGEPDYPFIAYAGGRVAVGNQAGLSSEQQIDNLEAAFRMAELCAGLVGLTSMEPAFMEEATA